jgi:hypothetical protein
MMKQPQRSKREKVMIRGLLALAGAILLVDLLLSSRL